MFLSEFFGMLLACSLAYLGPLALLPPFIGASMLAMTARGPGVGPSWGASLMNSMSQH
jgi:hypothetical protein